MSKSAVTSQVVYHVDINFYLAEEPVYKKLLAYLEFVVDACMSLKEEDLEGDNESKSEIELLKILDTHIKLVGKIFSTFMHPRLNASLKEVLYKGKTYKGKELLESINSANIQIASLYKILYFKLMTKISDWNHAPK